MWVCVVDAIYSVLIFSILYVNILSQCILFMHWLIALVIGLFSWHLTLYKLKNKCLVLQAAGSVLFLHVSLCHDHPYNNFIMLNVYHQSFVYTILKYCVDSECYNSTHLSNFMHICVLLVQISTIYCKITLHPDDVFVGLIIVKPFLLSISACIYIQFYICMHSS